MSNASADKSEITDSLTRSLDDLEIPDYGMMYRALLDGPLKVEKLACV